MALLTADDVLNKKFQPTKFREGYDQDEVDDFLDEVVNTLRLITAENEELKAKLAAAESALAEAGGEVPAPVEAAPEPVAEPAPEPEPEPAPVEEARPRSEPESAAGMLALAQKLHDEYVHNGEVERDRIVGEAQSTADRLVREAEEQKERTIGQLEEERVLLERKIDELRIFERDYRARLKSYLEGLLNDVEGRGSNAASLPSVH